MTRTRSHESRDEYAAFEASLRQVVRVPYSEIKAKLDAEKKAKKKRKAASRAANAPH